MTPFECECLRRRGQKASLSAAVQDSPPPVIAIMGPTASGKSSLAFKIARQLKAEIISVDAVAVYKMLDIGSAKPTGQQQAEIPHHLLDCVFPWEVYTVNDFVEAASAVIQRKVQCGIPLVLVGGTFLYFKGLIEGFSPLPQGSEAFRAQLLQEKERWGLNALYERLKGLDPQRASQIHPHDTHRIFRALEIFHLTHQPMSALLHHRTNRLQLNGYPNFHAFALVPKSLEQLKMKIHARFYEMVEQGFVEEVEQLFKDKRLSLNKPAIRSLGYRQLWDHCLGLDSKEKAFKKAIAAIGAFAKRQLTWLRSWSSPTTLLAMDDPLLAYQTILQHLSGQTGDSP